MTIYPRLLLSACLCFSSGFAIADTLERIRDGGTFRLGFREDTAPFSHRNAIGEPAGFSVELCRRVAAAAAEKLDLTDLKVDYVPVTAENRFQMLREGRIDVLCGPTTVTLKRREIVDFSLFTFIDGASVLFRRDGPAGFEALAGKKVGVRAGTTTEAALRETLSELGVNAEVVALKDHRAGLEQLENGDISAYFADRTLLGSMLRRSRDAAALRLSSRLFTHETYALGLPLGDTRFRLLVDRTLSRLYRSGEIETIFAVAFGRDVEPTSVLISLYLINGVQE